MAHSQPRLRGPLPDLLREFKEFGAATIVEETAYEGPAGPARVPTFVNEFWTSAQRAAHDLHEISYRACFKPQLPRFFIERLTEPVERVHDPFMGRGTTLLEAALLGRVPSGCDVNPLSRALIHPRLNPPRLAEVEQRMRSIDLTTPGDTPEDLLVFYHPDTLRELGALREYFLARQRSGEMDAIDGWIRMVALNRLTGHSPGFFSVYTLPPNQAVSVVSQKRINEQRKQTPPRRDVAKLILKKSRNLLKNCTDAERRVLRQSSAGAILMAQASSSVPEIPSGSVSLVVTSPPFLDVVDYATDNWLRCWFCGLDRTPAGLTVLKGLEDWKRAMTAVFHELARMLRSGGHVAFEVGEVRKGSIKLEESVLPCGVEAGLNPLLVLINAQEFTKTSNCWGVSNQSLGTNTNRIVVFQKP